MTLLYIVVKVLCPLTATRNSTGFAKFKRLNTASSSVFTRPSGNEMTRLHTQDTLPYYHLTTISLITNYFFSQVIFFTATYFLCLLVLIFKTIQYD